MMQEEPTARNRLRFQNSLPKPIERNFFQTGDLRITGSRGHQKKPEKPTKVFPIPRVFLWGV